MRAQHLATEELRTSIDSVKKIRIDTVGTALLLRLSQHYIFKPGNEKADMDSAAMFIKQAESLSKKLNWQKGLCNCSLQFSMLYREMDDRERGKKYAEQAVQLAATYREYYVLGESYLELSQYYSPWDMPELKIKTGIVRKALEAFTMDGNKSKQAFMYKNLGEYHFMLDSFPLSISELKRSLALYKEAGEDKVQAVYDLLASDYLLMSDYSTALKYDFLSLQKAKEYNDTSMQMCRIYNSIGRIYYNLTEYQTALDYFKKGAEVANRYHDILNLLWVSGNATNCYIKLKNYPEALRFLQTNIKESDVKDDNAKNMLSGMYLQIYIEMKDLKRAQRYNDELNSRKPTTIDVLPVLAQVKYYTAIGQFNRATALMVVFDSMVRPHSDLITRRSCQLFWFTLDSAKGNYPGAIAHIQEYIRLNDSLSAMNKKDIIETLKIEYEVANKDQDIKIKAQSIELLQKNLDHSRLVRNMIIGGILLLVIALALVFYQYRGKQKINKEIQAKNGMLQQLVDEKEWLLKEIHHRVKNNLQTIVSLLESQSSYLIDGALEAARDSQNRVYSMSLIHQKLYLTDNVASINMSTYLPELINYLKDCTGTRQRILFDLDIEPVEIHVSQAVPVGLILNEAITNAIKYAFDEEKPGNRIAIAMKKTEGDLVRLVISDNGKGLPEKFDPVRSGGLGIKLMKGLTKDIDGNFEITHSNGTTITVTFKAHHPMYRDNETALLQKMDKPGGI